MEKAGRGAKGGVSVISLPQLDKSTSSDQLWQRTKKASSKVSSVEIVDEWVLKNNLEQRAVDKLTPMWEARIRRAFLESDNLNLPDPSLLKTAVCCDVLSELARSLHGRLSAAVRPLTHELLTSTYRGYGAVTTVQSTTGPSGFDSSGQQRAVHAVQPVHRNEILPYFEIVNRINQEIASLYARIHDRDSRRHKIEVSQGARQDVLTHTVENREIIILKNAFGLWVLHTRNLTRQRRALRRLFRHWVHRCYSCLGHNHIQDLPDSAWSGRDKNTDSTSAGGSGALRAHSSSPHPASGGLERKSGQGISRYASADTGKAKQKRRKKYQLYAPRVVEFSVMSRFFKAWRAYIDSQHKKRVEKQVAKLVERSNAISSEFDADKRSITEFKTRLKQTQDSIARVKQSVANKKGFVAAFHEDYRFASICDNVRLAKMAADGILQGVHLIKAELHLCTHGQADAIELVMRGLAPGASSDVGKLRSAMASRKLFNPTAMLPDLRPEDAEHRLLSMDAQALLLCWLNHHVGRTGTSRKADNFTLHTADSECLVRMMLATTPRYSSTGDEIPRLSAKRVLVDTVDLEERAKALLAYADKVDGLLQTKTEVQSMLKPRDIVASTYPDIVAAWVARMCSQRFAVHLNVRDVERDIRNQASDLHAQVSQINTASSIVSVAWIQRLLKSYAELCSAAQHCLDAIDRGARLFNTLQKRVDNFTIVVLHRRLCDDPIQTVDFHHERERISALRYITKQRLVDLFPGKHKVSAQLSAIRTFIAANFPTIKRVFSFYAQSDVDDAASLLDWQEFLGMVGDLELLQEDKRTKKSARRSTGPPGAVVLSTHDVTLLFTEAARPLRMKVSTADKMADDGGVEPEVHLQLAKFIEVCVRIAALRYPKYKLLSDRVQAFFRGEVFRNARQLDLHSFLGQLRRPAFLAVLKQYSSKLRKVFLFYATSVSDIATEKKGKRNSLRLNLTSLAEDNSSAMRPSTSAGDLAAALGDASAGVGGAGTQGNRSKKASKWQNTIDFEEFLAIVRDCELIKTTSSQSKGGAHGCLTEEDAQHLFINIQLHALEEGLGRSGPLQYSTEVADMKDGTLTYPEFLEALAALACYRYPTPFLPLPKRFVKFIDDVFFPALRRKVQMGAIGQSAAVKNLIW